MRKLIRPVAVAGSLLAALTAVAGPASATTAPSGQAADWISKQLTDGAMVGQYGPDYGLSIDAAIALDAIGHHRAGVRSVGTAVARHLADYTTGEAYGDAGSHYAGATAKALWLAHLVGANPHRFGGTDLQQTLEGQVSASGRIHDTSQYGDYANVIGQSYAVAALSKAGSAKAGKATRFLLQQQCGRGFFRLNFSDPSAADQSCAGAPASLRAPDTDVTALAVLMLRTVDHPRPAVRHAIADAVTWLKRNQAKDGSFGGGTSTKASNSNSTGLAAWALGESGACRAARRAATWVEGLQVTSKQSGTKLRRQVGAIAYDRAGFRAGRTHGITAETQDQWRRASAQAAPGLAYLKASACS